MSELTISEKKAKTIQNALRLAMNALDSRNKAKETAMDRELSLADRYIKEVLGIPENVEDRWLKSESQLTSNRICCANCVILQPIKGKSYKYFCHKIGSGIYEPINYSCGHLPENHFKNKTT